MESSTNPQREPSRRTALKGLAGGAAAALVWAEPTIQGIARRPAYATAGSGSTFAGSTASVSNPRPGRSILEVEAEDRTIIDLVFNDIGGGMFTLSAKPQSPDCECRIVGVGGAKVAGDGREAEGEIVDGELKFTIEAREITDIKWEDLKIECR